MGKLISLASYPRVGVKVFCQNSNQGDTLQRITLFLSPTFVLDCPSPQVSERLIPWLENYAHHHWSFFPLPPYPTPFTQKAASFLQKTSPGQLLSYQEFAQAIGHPLAARAIGNFCRRNLFPLLVPCHRVIPSQGGLGCFTPDPRIKNQLLDFEGVQSLTPLRNC